jgi:SAM-dependent methyltransferase
MTQTAHADARGDQQAPATPAGSRGHHDWQSPEYVREWVGQYEARAASRRPQFDLLADLIPHDSAAPFRILDVGAGWGPVTRHLLTRFPAARSVLLDNSAPMFAEARARLADVADRVAYVQGDLSQPGAIAAAAVGGPFDAVVSSLCVHNLRPTERIPALYGEIVVAVAPGGCFLNLDLMGAPAPAVQEAWHRARLEQVRRDRLAETGTLPTPKEAEALLRAQSEGRRGGRDGARPAAASPQPGAVGAGGLTRTLLDHLLWLREAGFDAVECFWRQERQALIGGYRA